ncbi:MAG: hypothetical protein GXO43_09255 [Crenarchaeota archaeon]|nr:hypothetical protein [Thermoproteota archaeon]
MPCVLEEWQAREILHRLYKQYGSVRKLASVLGVSKSTLHRCLKNEQSIPPILRVKLCTIMPEEELVQYLKGKELLKKYGLLDEKNRLNKTLLLALLDAIMQEETMKETVLNYLLKYYKQDLVQHLSETLPKLELRWTSDFEKWLTEKKSKPISRQTLKDYKNIWFKCLEGKVLGWHLLKQLEAKKMMCFDNNYHPTGWLRQIFRHYVRYLYSIGKIDWDTYSRLLIAVPGRRYGRKVSQKVIREKEVILTLNTLSEKGRRDLLTLYKLMLFSGIRFMHVLEVLNNWRPHEELYIPYLNRNLKRLECKEDFCRYYLGKENSIKPAGFMFFPKQLLPLINIYRGKMPRRRRISKIVRKWNCLAPKYIRIYALREMKRVIGDNDVYRFIVGKFGELSVSARHYMDLLEEADSVYPNYIHHIQQLFEV